MRYHFSVGWFFVGICILLAGAALVLWHQKFADTFGGGVSSYDRYKLWGLIICGIGIVFMLNLHTLILTAIFSTVFPSLRN